MASDQVVLQMNKQNGIATEIPDQDFWSEVKGWVKDPVTGKSQRSETQIKNSEGMGLWSRQVLFARVRYDEPKLEVGEIRVWSYARPTEDLGEVA